MILDAIIKIFTFLMTSGLGLLPTSNGLNPDIQSSIQAFWGYMTAYAFILPINSIFIAVGVAMGFHASVFAWKVVNWFLGKVRGSN